MNFEPSFLIGLELVPTRSYTDVGANDTLWLQECPTCISVTVFKSNQLLCHDAKGGGGPLLNVIITLIL